MTEPRLAKNRLPPRRDPRAGIVLLTTLTLVLLISVVVALAQARARAGSSVFARLDRAEREGLARIAAEARLRPIMAEALTGNPQALPLDGTPFTLAGDGPVIEVRLNDIGGLVDLYFAPDALIAALPDGAALVAGRAGLLADQTGRPPVTEATLARSNLDAPARRRLAPFVTQAGTPGGVTLSTAPPELREAVERLGLGEERPIRALRVVVLVRR